MIGILSRLKAAISGACEIYKNGGIKRLNIAYTLYGNVLKDKVVLITGGSSGIGLAMAKKFAESGAKVIITGRNENKLIDAIKSIGTSSVKYLVWDVSDISILKCKLEDCTALFDREVDVLVNNAGIAPTKFWGNVDGQEWDKIYNINLKGAYFLTQSLVARWKEYPIEGYRKIINISSQGGFVGATYPYRMVKWDVRGLTEGLGKLLIKDNIIVNGIAPGVVKTEMQEFSLKQGDNVFTNQNPINRVCLPEEVAELALFLVSDSSNFIIGQTIVCDGGYILK